MNGCALRTPRGVRNNVVMFTDANRYPSNLKVVTEGPGIDTIKFKVPALTPVVKENTPQSIIKHIFR